MNLDIGTNTKLNIDKNKNINKNIDKKEKRVEKSKEKKIEKNENKFQKGMLNIANFAIDVGIRAALPNYLEDHVIDIKNTLMKNGIKEGVKEIGEKAKDIVNIILGKKNVSNKVDEIRSLTKQNGIIDQFSKVINFAIDKSVKNNRLNKNLASILKSGKTAMLSTFSDKLENNLYKEIKNIEDFKKELSNWNKCFDKKDVEGMNKIYNKLEKIYNNISVVLKEVIDFEKIKYTQKYIEKNKKEELNSDEIELLKKLA